MDNEEQLKAAMEAIIYVAPEPVSLSSLAAALEGAEKEKVQAVLQKLKEEYRSSDRGIEIRQVAGGYKFASKPEHHESVRRFVKSLRPPIRLSRQALETLAVIAYKQPATLPEIQEIRGVNASGVIKTLLDRKLITAAGRKDVVGRPILYKSTRNFLVHFGLNSLDDLPSMEEFEDIIRSQHAEQAELPLEMGKEDEQESEEVISDE